MKRYENIKNLIIKSLNCLLVAIMLCFACSNAFASTCGGETECHPACKYRAVESCTLCPIFVVVFNTVSKVSSLSAGSFSGAVMNVVVIMFAVWLALETIKFVSSMKTRDLKDFVQLLITKGFVVILVLTILRVGVGNFYNVFVQPVYNTAQNMSQIMFKDITSINSHPSDRSAMNDKSISGLKEFKDGLPTSMGASIVKTMTMMENRIRKVNALGSAVFCQSLKERSLIIIPKARYFIFGAVVWVLTVAMLVIIPFLMIDAVFQLGVAAALMPFTVGAYAFEYTRKKYCGKVIHIFLNSAFSFLFISVIVLILLGAIQTSVQNSVSTISNFDDMFAQGSSSGQDAFGAFLDSVTWGSGFLLNLFFTFVLAWSVMDMGKTFADNIANSISSTNIGSQLGSVAGSKAVGMGKKALAPAGAFAKKVGGGVAKRVGEGMRNVASRGKSWVRARRFNNVAAVNGVKSYTTTKRSLWQRVTGKKGANVLNTIDANGNMTRTSSNVKMSRDGKTKVETQHKEIRTKNAVLRITTKTTYELKNGSWVVKDVNVNEKMKSISHSAANILSPSGKLNAKAMENLLEGTSGETRDALRNSAIRQITESRFSKGAFDPDKEKLAKPAETTIDKATGEMITTYTTVSGEIIISKTKLRSDGLVESKLSRVNKDGRVMTFESDGIRNKMSVRLLQDGVDPQTINSENLENNFKRDKDGKIVERVGYSYTEYYQQLLQSGQIREKDIPNGMFFNTGTDGITRDENGEVVRDARGNIRGGSFARYRKGVAQDDVMHWEDLNFLQLGKSEEHRNNRRLYAGKILKGGNGYDAMEADMNFYFANSRSPKRTKNIFGGSRGI